MSTLSLSLAKKAEGTMDTSRTNPNRKGRENKCSGSQKPSSRTRRNKKEE